jgi:hypothetical protein
MSDYNYLSASDGSGDASLMHLTANRAHGATVYTVDSIIGVPANFIATCGTLLSTGFIDPTTKVDFKGHTSGSTLVIDAFEAGSTDPAGGNTSGQVIVIKPTTGWANRVATFIQNATGFGTPEAHTTSSIVNSGSITTGSLSNTGTYTGTNGSISTNYLTNPTKFSAYRGGGWTTSTGLGLVTFDTTTFDTGSNYSTSTGRFTAPVAGFYHFTANAGTFVGAGAGFGIALYKNGTVVLLGNATVSGGATYTNIAQVGGLLQLAVNDYIQVYFNGSGGTGTIGSSNTYFSGFLLSQT